MKLCFSNIGWTEKDDMLMYAALASRGFEGLEIAPTRLVGENPYSKLEKATELSRFIRERFGLEVCSMQSIWYGREESICASEDDRKTLLDYSAAALDFAKAVDCPNLVFGCPRNRSTQKEGDEEVLLSFFKELCADAARQGASIAIEANPPIYNTNFLNDTLSAVAFARRVGAGASVNLDFGTIIQNGEKIESLRNDIDIISHVHISEPKLAPIEKRPEHKALASLLRESGYEGFVSVEMRASGLEDALAAADYLAEVFA